MDMLSPQGGMAFRDLLCLTFASKGGVLTFWFAMALRQDCSNTPIGCIYFIFLLTTDVKLIFFLN